MVIDIIIAINTRNGFDIFFKPILPIPTPLLQVLAQIHEANNTADCSHWVFCFIKVSQQLVRHMTDIA